MGKALYRTYRSKQLSEIVGQEHITTALTNALKQGTISHAYLFTGPRGVGKTSVARILAHEINGLHYGDESTHLDIIEIDAASNRRIDEIRDLRDRVNIAPTSAKYKVYIIDEVHMLTREAFNALLKTLEEPPAHVVFILATTEGHKLPETIISRTQRFTFKPIELKKVIDHLKTIAKAEHIKIDDEALDLIARHGGGSFRDSISLLDQVRNSSAHITASEVLDLLGEAPATYIEAIEKALAAQDLSAIVTAIGASREQGYEAARIAKQLGESLRSHMLAGTSTLSHAQSLTLQTKLIRVASSSEPYLTLEIALLEAIPENRPPVAIKSVPTMSPVKATTKAKATAAPAHKQDVSAAKSTEQTPAVEKTPVSLPKDEILWSQILSTIKRQHNTLYGVLRMAVPTFNKQELTLAFQFAFHQKRINDANHRKIIADTIHELTGQTVTVICILATDDTPRQVEASPPEHVNATIDTISNIFGGAELLES